MKKQPHGLRVLVVVAVVALLLAACAPATPPPQPTATAVPSTPTPAAATAAPTQPPAPTATKAVPTAAPTIAPTAAPTVDPLTALLKAVSAQLAAGPMRVKSTITTNQGTSEQTAEVIWPDRFHLTLGAGQTAQEFIVIGSKVFQKSGGAWSEFPVDVEALIGTLTALLSEEAQKGIAEVKLLGSEAVDGVPATVYGFNMKLKLDADTEVSGAAKLWVSSVNGLPIKQEVSGDFAGVKSVTVQRIEYDPTIKIEAPAATSAGDPFAGLLKAVSAELTAGPIRVKSTVTTSQGTSEQTAEMIWPDRFHLKIGSGQTEQEFIIVGSKAYQKSGGKWSEFPVDVGALMGTLTATLTEEAQKGISEVKLIGADTVDGVAAAVYSFNMKLKLDANTEISSSAKLWVSIASGLPIKQEVSGDFAGVKSVTVQRIEYDPTIKIEAPTL